MTNTTLASSMGCNVAGPRCIQRRAPPALTEKGGTRVSTSRPMMANSQR